MICTYGVFILREEHLRINQFFSEMWICCLLSLPVTYLSNFSIYSSTYSSLHTQTASSVPPCPVSGDPSYLLGDIPGSFLLPRNNSGRGFNLILHPHFVQVFLVANIKGNDFEAINIVQLTQVVVDRNVLTNTYSDTVERYYYFLVLSCGSLLKLVFISNFLTLSIR